MGATSTSFFVGNDIYEKRESLSGRVTFLKNGMIITEAWYEEMRHKRLMTAAKPNTPAPTMDDYKRYYRERRKS